MICNYTVRRRGLVLVDLLLLATFLVFLFCSNDNLMPASNNADISGVRLTPPVCEDNRDRDRDADNFDDSCDGSGCDRDDNRD
jgi:hypothetical protein